jgi:hypothetical protein
MTVKDLRKFGILRKIFKGSGLVRFSDGVETRARFTLAQLADTQLLFSADADRSAWDFFTGPLEAVNLTGILSDGRTVSVEGLFLKNTRLASRGKTRLIGYSSHWTLGESDFSEATSVSFELVNFRFLGTETEESVVDGKQCSTLSLMTLNLGDRKVKLRRVPDYDQVEATLRAQRGVQVTCTATTSISSPSELDIIVPFMDSLCDVMSVARGTLICWTSFDINSSEDKPSYSRYRNSVTRRFAEIELIDDSDRDHTKSFLERGVLRCQELEPDFQIRKVARAFSETRDGPFIESRSLLIGVLAEYLASVRARLDNRVYFLDEETFESKWDSLKAEAKAALTSVYPEIVKKYLPAMLGNIKGLNRRPLSWKLNDLAKWLEVKFESGEVENFVKTRNKLAHEGKFPETGTPVEHYQRMQHFIDRLMLRLFDYHGPYYDFEHREMRQI